MASSKIIVNKNGPYLIQGDFEIADPSGKTFGLGGRPVVALCRCGHSQTKPFCDGAHGQAGFEHESEARDLPPKA